MDAQRARCSVPPAVGTRGKGGILFPKRIPPLEPPEKGDGCSPRPPTLPDWSSKSCTRCATADNRRESSRIATPNAATPRAGSCIPEAKGLFKPETANLTPFFWTVTPPVFFLGKENGGCGVAARRRHFPPHLCGISPLEFEQFHNCLFMFPHLRFSSALRPDGRSPEGEAPSASRGTPARGGWSGRIPSPARRRARAR